MKFTVMTLFPEQVRGCIDTSITGRALQKGVFSLETIQIRDFCGYAYGIVDDAMFGGGTGMLMQCDPVYLAWKSIVSANEMVTTHTVYLSPKGSVFTQKKAMDLSQKEHVILLCGHYEGIDERVIDEIVTDRVSIGDYVLTGGELPAMVMIDSISRLVPGVLHNDESAGTESFQDDLLEYPQYTRPEVWHEKKVPEILMSGDHAKIEKWRVEESVNITKELRPDLYEKYESVQEKVDRHKELSKSIRKMQHHISVSMKEVQK